MFKPWNITFLSVILGIKKDAIEVTTSGYCSFCSYDYLLI